MKREQIGFSDLLSFFRSVPPSGKSLAHRGSPKRAKPSFGGSRGVHHYPKDNIIRLPGFPEASGAELWGFTGRTSLS